MCHRDGGEHPDSKRVTGPRGMVWVGGREGGGGSEAQLEKLQSPSLYVNAISACPLRRPRHSVRTV